jgi:multiple sugar transport system permease protein
MLQNPPLTSGIPEQNAVPAAPLEKLSRRSRLEMILFTLPAFIFQVSWGWYPIIVALLLSFTNVAYKKQLLFVGTENYQRIWPWNDPLVMKAFKTTFTYAGMSIVLTFIIPILVAVLLMEMPKRAIRVMMLLWFLPLSGIAGTILWRYMYNVKYGLFQYIFHILGLPEQRFLNDAHMILFWLIFPGLLFFGPGLLYMAALQSIPQSYYEAAEIEGASFARKIWTISLPRLRPVIAMMLTFAIIGTLQEFSWPQILTGSEGQPGGSARMVVMYIYQPLLSDARRTGDATALAVLLFAVIMVITIVYRTLFKEDPDV